MKRKLKKAMSILLAASMVFGTAAGIGSFDFSDIGIKAEAAEEFTSGYYTYTVDENGDAIITDCDTSISGDVTIPSKLDGYPVKKIGYRAFEDCVNLTGVIIPENFTYIDSYAFYNCTNLKTVDIHSGVNWIGYYAFERCYELNRVTLPDSIETINGAAFSMCYKLTELKFPEGITWVGGYMFVECENLTNVTIPKSVTLIYEYAFEACTNLSNIYYSGSEKEWNEIEIRLGNECLNDATIHYNYIAEEEPTTAPTVELTTIPEESTIPSTTESTTKLDEEPTTKPAVTEPSTTKPTVEEELIKNPSTTEVKYGETLILHADFTNIPADAKIEWSVEGEGVTIKPSADGKTCAVTSTATGDVTITAKYVDANGVEHISEQEIESNASLWQKIVSFFKNLFGINRVIEQRIKF